MVAEKSWPELKTFERKPYFYTEGAASGVVFTAPTTGATTPNSDNPRSELRQMNLNGTQAAWSNKNETWNMEANLAFWILPTSSDNTRGVVAMQIHDGNDDVTVLRLERSGILYVTKGNQSHHDPVNPSYQLKTFMNVRVSARKGGSIQWYINNALVTTISGVYSGCFFKAGAYTQGFPPNSSGVGQTVFKSLRVWKS